jgi:hypothetical protein
MKQVTIDVSKKIGAKHVKQGEVNITVPTLADVIPFITTEIKKDDKGAEVYEDGLPVYVSDEANWVQSAMLASVKAQARNKLVSGTATLKDGATIATDWASLIAEGVRGGGEALAILREAKTAFSDWMAKQGKSEAATNTVITLFSNRQALALQSAANKGKIKAYVESFFEQLTEEQGERFARPLDAVIAACDAEEVTDF